MFWERFYNLCSSNSIKPNSLREALNISSGVLTKWKNGGVPNSETLIRIADYFDCSVDYLLGRTDIPEVNTLDNMVRIYTAARAKDGEHLDDNIQYVRETLIEKLRNAPASSDKL